VTGAAAEESIMPRADAVALLASRIVRALEEQKARGAGAYPLTLAQLPALVGADTTPEQITKALGKKPYSARLAVANRKSADSPLALAEDAAALAASPLLLRFALNGLCSADAPLQPLKKVEGRVEKALRPPFAAELARRLAANSWPTGVGAQRIKGKPHLYLDAFPPPPPPLPERLLAALCGPPPEGGWTVRRLAGPQATDADVARALRDKAVKAALVVALPGDPDSPAAAAADAPRLAASPALLERALAAARKPDHQAVTLADLGKPLDKRLRPAFAAAAQHAAATHTLPPAVGCLRIKKAPHFFLVADVLPMRKEGTTGPVVARSPDRATSPDRRSPAVLETFGQPAWPGQETGPQQTETGPQLEFARLFDEAFARLDRERGAHNLVSLVGLRRALPLPREAFDDGLRRLRREGRYSLSAAEGRHGLSAEEREAGLSEDGALLLYVSRRER
jgi:hypothetical protein